jgi:hypothetical protein
MLSMLMLASIAVLAQMLAQQVLLSLQNNCI